MEYDHRNALRKTISSSWIFTFSYLMYYFLELVCFEGVHLPMALLISKSCLHNETCHVAHCGTIIILTRLAWAPPAPGVLLPLEQLTTRCFLIVF